MGSNLKMKPRVTFLVADTKLKSHKAAHIFKKGYGRCNIMLSDEWVKYSKQGIYPKDLATYGILIGQYNDKGEFIKRARKKSKNFWHIDHGYFLRSSSTTSFDGYFRIVRNNLWNDVSEKEHSWDRFNSFNIKMKDLRKNGNHIVIIKPSVYMTKYFPILDDWLGTTINNLKQHTDRKIVVSTKNDNPLSECLKDAWCVVTDHSNAGIESMINGIPAIFTNETRKNGELSQVEDPPFDRSFFKDLAHCQWNTEEIMGGDPWEDTTSY